MYCETQRLRKNQIMATSNWLIWVIYWGIWMDLMNGWINERILQTKVTTASTCIEWWMVYKYTHMYEIHSKCNFQLIFSPSLPFILYLVCIPTSTFPLPLQTHLLDSTAWLTRLWRVCVQYSGNMDCCVGSCMYVCMYVWVLSCSLGSDTNKAVHL